MPPSLDRPQRRHRAAYIAPAAGQWHQQQSQNHQRAQQQYMDMQDYDEESPKHSFEDSLSDLGIPLMLEVPHQSPLMVSPPSSGEGSSPEFQQQLHNAMLPPLQKRSCCQLVTDAIWGMYSGFVDFFLLVVVCFMGCFFYDVEVKVVQEERYRPRGRGRRGRVFIRTNEEEKGRATMTNLLRTPPRSGNFSRSSRSTIRDPHNIV
mmetsp:Transcript_86200/g.248913  ORF Transcript_86200/g.248913 Transcript_86200/m.248913 type:complete len:205 (-) Transcript_86200:651-1265(-)